jgi:hypothetical protein
VVAQASNVFECTLYENVFAMPINR